jgi:hypothetical protein
MLGLMEQNAKPILDPRKRLKRIYAKPSKTTLQFLRDFARTYTPDNTSLSNDKGNHPLKFNKY